MIPRRAIPAGALAAVLCALALGCSGPRAERAPEAQAALARPEPDPECWGTVRDRLIVNGVQQVTVQVSVDRSGAVERVRFLSPDLTAAQQQDLRRACESCPWKPGVTAGGAPAETSTGTYVFGTGGEKR
jgi:hypothetical protein